MATMYADKDVPITTELFRSVMPTGFALTAFSLSFLGAVQCNAIKFISTSGFEEPVTVQFGFTSHEDVSFFYSAEEDYRYVVKSCVDYSPEVDIDTKWKAATAFSILPLCLGGFSFLWMVAEQCSLNPHWFDCVVYLLAFFFQGLSLLLLDSNACKNNSVIQAISDAPYHDGVTFPERCSISTGMKCIISAIVFWFLAALTSVDTYMAKRKREDAPLTEPLIEEVL